MEYPLLNQVYEWKEFHEGMIFENLSNAIMFSGTLPDLLDSDNSTVSFAEFGMAKVTYTPLAKGVFQVDTTPLLPDCDEATQACLSGRLGYIVYTKEQFHRMIQKGKIEHWDIIIK